MKLICPSCGARYEKGKFCPECGSPLSEVATKKVLFCPSCQTEVPSGKFCPECGTKLEEREIEIGAESNAATPAEESSTQITEPSVDPEVEAILAKYRDEFGDMRELNKEEYAIAAEEFEKCASKGSLDGMCYLALLYFDGNGVTQDHARAYDLLREAERKGSHYAKAFLGIFYARGIIVEADENEAVTRFTEGYKKTKIPGLAGSLAQYYVETENYAMALIYAQEAADKFDKTGLLCLGAIYLNGWCGEQNNEKAFECYMQAAAQGEETALNQIGWMYQNGCGIDADPEQAFFWYNEAAQKGSDVGMANLAFCYQNGYGVGQDAEVAAEWFKKSAEAGYVDSMVELGEYYQSTLFDTEKSKYWLLKAVECGNAEAMNRLGVICADDIEPNYEEAIKWYEKAIEQGWPMAYRNLAILYIEGRGVKKDLKRAEELLSMAAKLGVEDAEILIDNIRNDAMTKAESDETALNEAIESLLKGTVDTIPSIIESQADAGNPRAINAMGICYIDGKGVPTNPEKANMFFRRAADLGYIAAMYNLGKSYYQGSGFDQSYNQAAKWYSKAAKLDYAPAQLEYAFMHRYGLGVNRSFKKYQEWLQKSVDNKLSEAIKQKNVDIENFKKGFAEIINIELVEEHGGNPTHTLCLEFLIMGKKNAICSVAAKLYKEDSKTPIDLYWFSMSNDSVRDDSEIAFTPKEDYEVITDFSMSYFSSQKIYRIEPDKWVSYRMEIEVKNGEGLAISDNIAWNFSVKRIEHTFSKDEYKIINKGLIK